MRGNLPIIKKALVSKEANFAGAFNYDTPAGMNKSAGGE